MNATDRDLPLTEWTTPTDVAGVAEAVRAAGAKAAGVYPQGGGTRQNYGPRPTRPGVGLSLGGLNRVIDYPAGDMTITVEAGLTIAELTRHLGTQCQRLPVDLRHDERATIGGALATNASGPRRFGCGTLRDWVLGLTAVDGLGNVFSSGGRVVKNAAGLNVHRLLIGSLGTLGVITQVTLMVRPQPERSAFVVCDLPELDAAEALLAALVQTEALPTAIELVCGPAWSQLRGLPPGSDSVAARLLVGFEATAAETGWMAERLCHQWRGLSAASPAIVAGAEVDQVWSVLTALEAEAEVRVPPSELVSMLGVLRELDAEASFQAHAGNGVILARFGPRVPDRAIEFVRGRLRPAVESAGGRLTLMQTAAVAELTADDIWGPPGEGAALARAVKERFDPQGILNPGRYRW